MTGEELDIQKFSELFLARVMLLPIKNLFMNLHFYCNGTAQDQINFLVTKISILEVLYLTPIKNFYFIIYFF